MRRHSVADAAGLLAAIAILVLVSATHARAQSSGTPQPTVSWTLYSPLALRHAAPVEQLPPSSTPAYPTASTPTPTPTPDSTAEPPGDHGRVVFQIATYGGLSIDLYLGWMPSETPWFTLYDDGTYIRIHSEFSERDGSLRRSVLTGQLSQHQMKAVLVRLVDDIEFFDLPEYPPDMICVTDGPTDHVYLSRDDRTHRMHVYGLTSYTGRWPCPTPWPLDDRMIALARFVDSLAQPLTDVEPPYQVQVGTLVATEDSWTETASPWPFQSVSLAPQPGDWMRAVELRGDLARDVMRAIAENEVFGTVLARFSEDDIFYLVGFRIEFPEWNAYK